MELRCVCGCGLVQGRAEVDRGSASERLACIKNSSLCGTMLHDHPDSWKVKMDGPDVQSEKGAGSS